VAVAPRSRDAFSTVCGLNGWADRWAGVDSEKNGNPNIVVTSRAPEG
jgi:hypothetical protein